MEKLEEFDFENDINSKEKVAALLGVKPEKVVAAKMMRDISATVIWGARGRNGVFDVTSDDKIYKREMRDRKRGIKYLLRTRQHPEDAPSLYPLRNGAHLSLPPHS